MSGREPSNVLFLLVFYLETLVSCPEDRLGCVHLEGHKGEAFTYLLKGYFPHLSEGEEVRLVCVAGPERGPRSIGQRRAGTGTALASLCPGGGMCSSPAFGPPRALRLT